MQDKIDKAKKVKAKYEQEWIQNPEVVSIGIGMLDEQTPGIIIGVKSDPDLLKNAIPLSIEDVPILLQITGEIKAL